MKYVLLSALLLVTFHSNAQGNRAKDTVINGQAFTYVEQMPESQYDLQKYLKENLRYPEEAKKNKIQGRVLVEFVVNENGRVSDCLVKRSLGNGCDEEAVRITQNMPPWKPGKQNGKSVKVKYIIPVVFNLETKARE